MLGDVRYNDPSDIELSLIITYSAFVIAPSVDEAQSWTMELVRGQVLPGHSSGGGAELCPVLFLWVELERISWVSP